MVGATKRQVERDLDEVWQELKSAVQSVPAGELERSGVVESWTIKDLLGHIAFWTNQATANLELIATGRADEINRPGGEKTTAEWNERERRLRRGQSLAVIREEWLRSFEDVRRALASFPAEKLEDDVGGRPVAGLFAEDTYEHYREHLGHVEDWWLRVGKEAHPGHGQRR